MRTNRIAFGLVLALIALVSWSARGVLHRRVELFGHSGWVTTDPDTLYQARRVERVFAEGLPVAGRDELLDAPNGSAIPWPPYYTLSAYGLLAPFAPAPPADRHEWIERGVASLARIFGVLGRLTVALVAWRLSGRWAALLAGLLHALSPTAVAYAKVGNGDHHAFVSWVTLCMLFALSHAATDEVLNDRARSARWGAVAGACAGLAMGAWVASLMAIVQAQLVLGALVVAHSRRPRAGTASLGLAFHLTALAVLAPAILWSPWRDETPWSVVNLSWFHAAYLLVSAAVFAPLPWLGDGSNTLRRWPWIVLASLGALGAFAAFGGGAWPTAMRESFAWAGRTDAFMARIGESRRLVGPDAGGAVFTALGFGVVLFPLALGLFAWRAWRERSLSLAFWTVAAAGLALQAASQARFAEALSGPMSITLACAAAYVLDGRFGARMRSLPAALGPLLALGLVVAAQWPTLGRWYDAVANHRDATKEERPATLGVRMACDWIAQQPQLESGESVLANWAYGHAIEWAAQRASVATNFGTYVGEEGFRAPPRWFLYESEEEGDALLRAHRSRFVLVDSDLPSALNSLIAYGAPERRERYVAPGSEHGGAPKPEWFLTLGARALFDGYIGPRGVDGAPFSRLRIVWMAPLRDARRPLRSPKDLSPAAFVWERVEGAVLEAHGAPGAELVAELVLAFPLADRQVRWRASARADSTGVARLRVPYSTDGRGGEGRLRGPARYTFGSRSGTFELRDADVREGRTALLR